MKETSYPWWLLSVTSLGITLVGLNTSTINVALPEIANHFHAGAVASSWILLSYMLFNTILILFFGKLADIFGRRSLYLLGLIEFTLTSFLLGFVPNVWGLILLRALQAAGGALIITNTTPLITDAFPANILGMGLGINVFISSASQMIGPVVGGYFVHSFGWRWVFWFNVPVGIIGIIWGFLTLRPSSPQRASGEKIDTIGNLFIFFGLGGLIYALSDVGVSGWTSTPVLVGLTMFVVFTVCFFRVERRIPNPILDFNLFHDRPFAMAILATFLNATVRSSVVVLMALFFQVVESYNPLAAGLMVLPVTLGMTFASPLAGYLATRFSARQVSTCGLLGTCVGMVILCLSIGLNNSPHWLSLGEFLVGFGSGIFMTPNTQSIMLRVPSNRRGIANGLRSMLQNMGQVLSTALSLTLATCWLPVLLKDAFFAGANANLNAAELSLVAKGYQTAFFVMILLTVVAIAASYLREGSPKTIFAGSSKEE